MIVFDLECREAQHRFEGWFKSSDDYARQQERGLVACPHCGSGEVAKAVQAPRLARKGNQLPQVAPSPAPARAKAPPPSAPVANAPLPPQAAELMQALATMQAEALKSSRYVGESFAKDARAMHYGEREVETIHGQASPAEAKELIEEGIGLMPLPFPVVPPEQAN
ncbi:DUF1178 family protein [Novosphingobium resinovorum]|jgi:hypothetical protein|uniref:Uncharacterized protein n=1 Tax=Novosphingobium resinovorum TaxID=158500 RepID=A0A031K6Q8_9SPHN|nr:MULTISPECIES: DUF1178 family protein [Sphingomonadaceae]AOR75885.1 hypothetical protein BES08_03310 [Novosphingobium resinovorum]EJU12334.1 hypothetical protein LH128_14254 [Sphingomonas sp. LH128]EZP84889.1 hypothetical protein BV97_00651 [Novosphingobium resinovorum]MBF7011255.1 DUF1178 family protein [Novosphingobium sp. HR1a]WJM29239.1 DUF1178 family protein [Novosphingobium resinovorum]